MCLCHNYVGNRRMVGTVTIKKVIACNMQLGPHFLYNFFNTG
jgi:hypothetical protein